MGRDDEKDPAPKLDSPKPEDTSDGGAEQGRRRGRRGLRETARRLLEEPGAVREAKEALGAVIDTSDKAKTEIIRMVGREVRAYLEGLGMKDGILHLLTHYSLEVNASLHLKPLNPQQKAAVDEPAAAKPDA
jgi:hypothetical protein